MPNIKRIILLIGDIAVLYASLWLVLFIRYGAKFDINIWQQHFTPFTIIYTIWLVIFFIAGLYDISLARNNINFYSTLLRSLTINIGIAITFFYFLPFFGITPKTNLFLNIATFAVLFTSWRQLYNHLVKSTALINNVLIIGKNKEIDQIIKIVENNPQLSYKIIKQISPSDIKTPFDILEMATSENIKTIITAINPHQDARLVQSLYQCLPLKISFNDLPSFYEKILGKVPISGIGEIWFLENLTENEKNFYEAFKRIFDMLGASIFGLISLIFYPIIILAIKIDSKGPVFYRQRRISQDGQIFKVIKFRSMVEEAEKNGAQWADQQDHRITKVGKFIRKIRLDELPQLWNVFIGQMSFIGPRPERIEFVQQLENEIPYYQIRHIVKPGLTGWAQVNFHYGASVKDSIEKLQFELYYIKHRSLVLDLSILLRTIKIIIKGGGR